VHAPIDDLRRGESRRAGPAPLRSAENHREPKSTMRTAAGRLSPG
jgi:hypothetical protein